MSRVTLPPYPWEPLHEAVLGEGRAKPTPEEAALTGSPQQRPTVISGPRPIIPPGDEANVTRALLMLKDELSEVKRALTKALLRITELEAGRKRGRR